VPCIIVSPWTVGGYVSHETFDHTSVIQLIETVTGVKNPNITDWRRSVTGDLTSALGAGPARRFPRLPSTTAALEKAEEAFKTLPLPPIPGKQQVFPVQGPGTKPVRTAPASKLAVKGA
jgi:phospholipase C